MRKLAEPARLASRRREKCFGLGRPRPLDRQAKARITARAEALSRRTEAGKAYGAVTAKALAVLKALLWKFHNSKTGLCFPALATLAQAAGCARSTAARAIKALEAAGVLTWVNRLVRVRQAGQVRVVRTSNAYEFAAAPAPERANSSKSDFPTGSLNQESFSCFAAASRTAEPANAAENAIGAALARLARLAGFTNNP